MGGALGFQICEGDGKDERIRTNPPKTIAIVEHRLRPRKLHHQPITKINRPIPNSHPQQPHQHLESPLRRQLDLRLN